MIAMVADEQLLVRQGRQRIAQLFKAGYAHNRRISPGRDERRRGELDRLNVAIHRSVRKTPDRFSSSTAYRSKV